MKAKFSKKNSTKTYKRNTNPTPPIVRAPPTPPTLTPPVPDRPHRWRHTQERNSDELITQEVGFWSIISPREPRAVGRQCAGPASPRLLIEHRVLLSDYYERQGPIVALPHGHPAEDVHRPARRRLPPHKRKR